MGEEVRVNTLFKLWTIYFWFNLVPRSHSVLHRKVRSPFPLAVGDLGTSLFLVNIGVRAVGAWGRGGLHPPPPPNPNFGQLRFFGQQEKFEQSQF